MSYGGVENTLEELEFMRGATITRFEIVDGEELRMHVCFPKEVETGGPGGIPMRMGVVGIWQDEEGNGPGYLAFLGTLADVVASDRADDQPSAA